MAGIVADTGNPTSAAERTAIAYDKVVRSRAWAATKKKYDSATIEQNSCLSLELKAPLLSSTFSAVEFVNSPEEPFIQRAVFVFCSAVSIERAFGRCFDERLHAFCCKRRLV